MEFNKLVKRELFPILQKYGFEIKKEINNSIIQFSSPKMKINIASNEYDNSILFEIGKQTEELYPLTDKIIKELFNLPLHIDQVDSLIFIKNIRTLLNTEKGHNLLSGNIKELKKINIKISKDYTDEIIKEQLLVSASNAWEIDDYSTFIKNIEKIGISEIPESYRLKYKIAKNKLP